MQWNLMTFIEIKNPKGRLIFWQLLCQFWSLFYDFIMVTLTLFFRSTSSYHGFFSNQCNFWYLSHLLLVQDDQRNWTKWCNWPTFKTQKHFGMEKISHIVNMMVPINKTCFELIFQWKLCTIIFIYTDGYEGLQGSSIKYTE